MVFYLKENLKEAKSTVAFVMVSSFVVAFSALLLPAGSCSGL